MAEKRKTLRDYILEGGIKGKYFVREVMDAISVTSGKRKYEIYQVIDLQEANGIAYDLHRKFTDRTDTYKLYHHYNDKEATPKQIEKFRAKESKLAIQEGMDNEREKEKYTC